MTIKRIWHGWTLPRHADAYERLLDETIVPGITDRRIPGHLGTEILRGQQESGAEIDFVTIMTFDSWQAVEAFAGGDGTASVVPDAARELLSRFDERASHYDVVADHPSRSVGRG